MEVLEVYGIKITNPKLIEEYMKFCLEFNTAQFSYISSVLEKEKRNCLREIKLFKDIDSCCAVQGLIKLDAINFTIATLREQVEIKLKTEQSEK